MKSKYLMGAIALMLLVGCAKETPVATEYEPRQDIVQAQTRAGVVENAIYDAMLDVWMAPDPQPQARAAQDGEPTHFALKIYPRTEAEQWEVEMMEDVFVSYIPFGMVQLTEDERAKLLTKSAAHAPEIEVSPYTVTYDNTNATDGGSTEPQILSIPILYTIWPADKPLPEHLEYVKDHDVWQPQMTTQAKTRVGMSYPVQLFAYDNLLNRSVPLANAKVTAFSENIFYDPYGGDPYRPGYWVTFSLSATTDANGYFDLSSYVDELLQCTSPTLSYFSLPLTVTYSDPSGRWKITSDSSTAPLTTTVYELFNYDYTPDRASIAVPRDSSGRQESYIHRAVNYFFNVQTEFPKLTQSGGMHIIASNTTGGSAAGSFDPTSGKITTSSTISTSVVSTTLHEIGHYIHWHNIPSSMDFGDIHRLMKESFASYVGWYLGEKYYKSFGLNPTVAQNITNNNRQTWSQDNNNGTTPGSHYKIGWYSPLFIDLADDYNQRSLGTLYPNDVINGVPSSAIWDIVTSCTTWDQYKAKLRQKVGTQYCTTAQREEWLDNFDYWISTYHSPLDYDLI